MQFAVTIRRNGRVAARAACAGIVFCGLWIAPAFAQQSSTDTAAGLSSYNNMRTMINQKSAGPANTLPTILNGVGIAQHLNEQIPLNLTFTDDAGRQVQLADYFGKKPAILALVYYRCPMLCSEELDGLVRALEMVSFVPGKDFNIIVVSIDPTEGTDLAAAKKREDVKRYGHPDTANGWHFLTGTQPNIDALTNVVGFHYVKLKVPGSNLTQFAHASAIQIVTPEGKLAQYYMGVEYSPKDLLLGLDEASSNRIGSPVDNILTYCYHYDPQTNTHSLIVSRVIQLGGLLTLILLGGFMTIMFRRDYRQQHKRVRESESKEAKVNG